MITMFRSYKYKLYPTAQQRKQIDTTMSICRYVYNIGLETKIRAWQSDRVNLSAFDLQKQLTEAKKEFPWLCDAASNALDASLANLGQSYNAFFNGAGFPKFKSRKGRQSFQAKNGLRRLDFNKNTLSICRIYDIPIMLSRRFNGQIRAITISRETTGKYYASILVRTTSIKQPKLEINSNRTIGLDLGVKSFAVSSDGRTFEANQKLRSSLKRLGCLQRRASRKKKGGSNRKKASLKVALLHEKIVNQRTDYIHKITTALVCDSQADTFVIEDLNVAGMVKNGKLSRSISDASFGEFARQMKYKCDWYGKNLIVIDRFAPSSKRCSDCGTINQDLMLADREWICECGSHHDRDHNAAKNIKYYGLLKHSGRGTPGEPVESPSIEGAVKQEDINIYHAKNKSV